MQYLEIDREHSAESARYALLRRLAPALRHQMAGGFQPVTMMAAIIEKRLQAAAPDLPALAKTSKDVRQLAMAATRTSLDLIGWIAPDPEARVPLCKGVHEGLHLITTELSFRGFKCVDETGSMTAQVALGPMRGVFVAALLAITDAVAKPATVRVTAQAQGADVVVTILLTEIDTTAAESGGSSGTGGSTGLGLATAPDDDFLLSVMTYRKIAWADVESIAPFDGVTLLQHTPNHIELRLAADAG